MDIPGGEEKEEIAPPPPPPPPPPPVAVAAAVSVHPVVGGGNNSTRSTKRGEAGSASSSSSAKPPAPVDAAYVALLATAAQQLLQAGFPATAHILQTEGIPAATGNSSGGSGATTAATNHANNDPPFHVHWSKSDMASSLRTDTNQSTNANSSSNNNSSNNSSNSNSNNNNMYDNGMRLSLHGAWRSGYRMARASHGTNTGTYYYECFLLPGPTATDLVQNLPANARLGLGLKERLAAAVEWEDRQKRQKQQQELQQQQMAAATNNDTTASSATSVSSSSSTASISLPTKKKRKTTATSSTNGYPITTDLAVRGGPKQQQHYPDHDDRDRPPRPGGHVRLGWSMRTADLQAPVGYDKWSYAIRSLNGAIVHHSQRNDYWGGEPFRDYDVIGCCIQLAAPAANATNATAGDNNNSSTTSASNSTSNSIRFFKNGNCLGKFAIVKGKLDGGVAFTDVAPGTYYPAVSCYLGGAVRANFGPYWICPPKKSRLNLTIEPIAALRGKPPVTADAAVEQLSHVIKLFKRGDQQQGLKRLVRDEANRQREAHERFLAKHVAEIRALRRARGAATHDLPSEPVVVDHAAATTTSTDPATTTTTTAVPL